VTGASPRGRSDGTISRVLLVQMPWASVQRPSLGLSSLKAQLARVGVRADVLYLNLVWAEYVLAALDGRAAAAAEPLGLERDLLLQSANAPAMADEWVFARAVFGNRIPSERAYRQRFPLTGDDATHFEAVLALSPSVEDYLNRCLAETQWEDYDIVGFSSTFRQQCASLAMAARVKHAHPATLIVFGGANCETCMGESVLRHWDFVDYVVSGEGEHAFPALLASLAMGRAPSSVLGVYYRHSGEVRAGGSQEAPAPVVMDDLPTPDFSDFFAQFDGSVARELFAPRVTLEQSRGCWWGQRKHCTFCGLNGTAMAYRSKSAERALEELNEVRERYGARRVDYSDNIFNHRFFETLLPALERLDHGVSLFYELKANVTRKQVARLRAAGVNRVQPGIESLSSSVLRLMQKGCTALQNVQCLKWCFQYGIRAQWNVLYGFPGEQPKDYTDTLVMLESISHLHPPHGCFRISLQRFSPHFERAADFGFARVRPAAPYGYLYPLADHELVDLAYSFDYGYVNEQAPETYIGAVRSFVKQWRDVESDRGQLVHAAMSDGGAILEDTRFNRHRAVETLSPTENTLYTACDEARGLASLSQLGLREEDMLSLLDRFVSQRWMIRDGDRFLAVAPTAQSCEPARFDKSVDWLALVT
jgi:ribosomal peptide maturation radical SAM protein 1